MVTTPNKNPIVNDSSSHYSADNRFCEEAVSKIAELLKDGRYQARVTGYRSDGNAKVHLYKCQNNEVCDTK